MDITGELERSSVRSSREIKQSLLRRAFAENRGAEMIQEILTRVRRAREMPEGHKEALELARHWDDACGNVQAIRKLNLRAHEAGTGVTYHDDGGHSDRRIDARIMPGSPVLN